MGGRGFADVRNCSGRFAPCQRSAAMSHISDTPSTHVANSPEGTAEREGWAHVRCWVCWLAEVPRGQGKWIGAHWLSWRPCRRRGSGRGRGDVGPLCLHLLSRSPHCTPGTAGANAQPVSHRKTRVASTHLLTRLQQKMKLHSKRAAGTRPRSAVTSCAGAPQASPHQDRLCLHQNQQHIGCGRMYRCCLVGSRSALKGDGVGCTVKRACSQYFTRQTARRGTGSPQGTALHEHTNIHLLGGQDV